MPDAGIATRSRVANAAQAEDLRAVERIRQGDLAALEGIMRRYNQRLFRIARGILGRDDLAEDAVQEAYISAYYGLDGYVPGGSFAGWLARIAVNEALMMRRKQIRHDARQLDREIDAIAAPADGAGRETDPVGAATDRDLARRLEQAIDRLPDDFRAVFVMRAVEEMSISETAAALAIKPATVKTRFHRARRLMRQSLDHELDAASARAFEFAGRRCDRIVAATLRRLAAAHAASARGRLDG